MSFLQTLDQLRALRLPTMAEAFQEQESTPAMQSFSWQERVSHAVEREVQAREQRRMQTRRKKANLKSSLGFEDIDWLWPRKLDRQVMLSLKSCEFVKKALNVIFLGPTGVGKSALGMILCEEAIRKGFTARRTRLDALLVQMEIARGDGSLLKLRADLAKTNVLMLDDWGMPALLQQGRQDLMEIIEDRVETSTTIITSQLPVDKWHEYIGETWIADAVLDRLVHRAYRVELEGESMRKKQTVPKLDGLEEK